MKKLDEMQIKQLTVDTTLAAEFKSNNIELRGFISVFAYQYKEPKTVGNPFGNYVYFDKFIKNVDMDYVFFRLRKYEIAKVHMESNYEIHESYLIDEIRVDEIKGIENIEKELLKYIDDLSVLQPWWKCEMPV